MGDVTKDLEVLRSADLVGARRTKKAGETFYEFDMAVAPATCRASTDDLGLGFCPYDTIYLLSATVLSDRLYVMVVESTKSEWKQSNSDLKQVRSSFNVA